MKKLLYFVCTVVLMQTNCTPDEQEAVYGKLCPTSIAVTTIEEGTDEVKYCLDEPICNLRSAISQANTCTTMVAINLTNATYVFTAADANSMNSGTSAAEDDRIGKVALPRIQGNIQIEGNGATLKVEAASDAKFRMFHVREGATLILKNMIITGAVSGSGGAIINEGNLVLENCTFLNDSTMQGAGSGGAVTNSGQLNITDCSFTSCYSKSFSTGTSRFGGGALFNDAGGICSITNTDFTLNNCGYPNKGGAIYNKGELTLTGCLFDGNIASHQLGNGIGGAIFSGSGILNINECLFVNNHSYATGTALYLNTTDCKITNSTFTGNYVDGTLATDGASIISMESKLTLNFVTIFGNTGNGQCLTGGLDAIPSLPDHPVLIENTIMSNNIPGDCHTSTFTGFTLGANNFIGDQSCGATNTATNPMLGPLADNGGRTKTFMPLTGSPVIDKGNVSDVVTDQRKSLRPKDGDGNGSAINDLGSVEK